MIMWIASVTTGTGIILINNKITSLLNTGQIYRFIIYRIYVDSLLIEDFTDKKIKDFMITAFMIVGEQNSRIC